MTRSRLRATVRTSVTVASIVCALAPMAAAKKLVIGVRHYLPPNPAAQPIFSATPLSLDEGPTTVTYGRRPRAGRYHGAYRPAGLRRPRALAGSLAHTADSTLRTGAGFPGLSFNGDYPADTQVGVGPQQIVELTNTQMGVYSRDGARRSNRPLASILGVNADDDLSDPQIAWDQTSGRWIATAMSVNHGAVDISVSGSADPSGGWFAYQFLYGSRSCPDQPRLGFSGQLIVVATEMFNAGCHAKNLTATGAVMLVLDKQAVLTHAPTVTASQYGPSAQYQNYVPVQMLSAAPLEYIASTDSPTSRAVHVLTLTGAPPNDQLSVQNTLLISRLNDPTFAAQRGGGVIDAGDDRINDASWQNGVLYLAADDQCTYTNDQFLETCARVMEITTGGSYRLIGENDIGYPSGDAYYAALRPDNAGNLIITYGYSDPNTYPSMAVTAAIGPITGEQGGTFTGSYALAVGTSPTIRRWGDYQAAAVDPQNPAVVWVAGQVADDYGTGKSYWWGTFLQSVAFGTAAPYVLRHQVDGGYSYRGQTTQRQKVSVLASGTGSRVANVKVTLRLGCPRRRHDTINYTLTGEKYAPVDLRSGRFTIGARFGADQ